MLGERLGGTSVFAGVALVLLGSCESRPRVPSAFSCYKSSEAAFRECAPKLSMCETRGCFERAQAFCFPHVYVAGEFRGMRSTSCTPSARECEQWRRGLTDPDVKATGECTEMRPDEYLELK